jgi:RNA polymerase sigma-70 factor (ECF subfamily)
MSGSSNWAWDTTECATADAHAQAEALITAIYTQYASAIHSYAFRLLGNQEDADDVTQEVFIRVQGRLEQLREVSRLRPWLYRIATNLCMDQLRRRSRIRRVLGFPITLDRGDDADDGGAPDVAHPMSSQAIDGVAERDHISRALHRMPPKYAVCLVLHSAQGLSYREIAEALGITPGAAAVRLARARDMFERHYEDLREEGRR